MRDSAAKNGLQDRKEPFRIMDNGQKGIIAYSIFNPTGNITALVESGVELRSQPAVADEIMKAHPEVEQVGFLKQDVPMGSSVQAELRMAGGEFCGNATMCAGAMFLLRRCPDIPAESCELPETKRDWEQVCVRVSGVTNPVQVCLKPTDEGFFTAGVMIPEATAIEERVFSLHGMKGSLPLIRMEGISHLIAEETSPFFQLKQDPDEAEHALKEWCGALSVSGLGIMFLNRTEEALSVTPLVYVPESGTVFWENSCASGSAAVGMYMANESGKTIEITLNEPGGKLMVRSNPHKKETWLFGQTRFVRSYTMNV